MKDATECVRCGNPAKPGRKRCEECTMKAAEWNRARYHKRKSEGVCPHCGSLRVTTRSECGTCRERRFRKNITPIKRADRDRMSWTISVAKEPDHLYVVVKGTFEIGEFNEMLDDVSTLKKDVPAYPVLFNDLEFDVSKIKKNDVECASSHFIMNNQSLADSRVAIVMKSIEDVKLADRWRSMTQPASSAQLNVFSNERKARKWLAQPA